MGRLIVGAASLVLAASGAVVPTVAFAASAPGEPAWLQHLNEIRIASGVAPVEEVPSWAPGIAAHLRYLSNTPARLRSGAFASRHTENPKSSWFSEAGRRAGERSNLVYDASSAVDAVDDLLAAPFHAIAMLRPELRRVGFAFDAATSYAGLDVIGGLGERRSRSAPIMFPGHGSVTGLSRFTGENPDPIETCRRQHPGVDWSDASLPMFALLPQRPTAGLVATLDSPTASHWSTDPNLCVITSSTYTSSDPVSGPGGRAVLEKENAVIVVARRALQEGEHTVTLRQPGRAAVTWSFVFSAERGRYATRSVAVTRSAVRTVTVATDVVRSRRVGTVRREMAAVVAGRRFVGVGVAPVVVTARVARDATATRKAEVTRSVTVTCRGKALLEVIACARDHARRSAAQRAAKAARTRADRLATHAAAASARRAAIAAAEGRVRRAPGAAPRRAAVEEALARARTDLERQLSAARSGSTR